MIIAPVRGNRKINLNRDDDDVEVSHYIEIKSFGCHFKVTQLDDWVKAVKEQKDL